MMSSPSQTQSFIPAMTAIARDEVEHLAIVCRLLARRGGGPAAARWLAARGFDATTLEDVVGFADGA